MSLIERQKEKVNAKVKWFKEVVEICNNVCVKQRQAGVEARGGGGRTMRQQHWAGERGVF